MLQNRLRKEKKILISVAELKWCLFVPTRLAFSVWHLAAGDWNATLGRFLRDNLARLAF